MKKTITLLSFLLLLSACGTTSTPPPPPTTDTTPVATAPTADETTKTPDEVPANEKSPSTEEGDIYFKAIETGDVKLCAQIASEFLKSECEKKAGKQPQN